MVDTLHRAVLLSSRQWGCRLHYIDSSNHRTRGSWTRPRVGWLSGCGRLVTPTKVTYWGRSPDTAVKSKNVPSLIPQFSHETSNDSGNWDTGGGRGGGGWRVKEGEEAITLWEQGLKTLCKQKATRWGVKVVTAHLPRTNFPNRAHPICASKPVDFLGSNSDATTFLSTRS